MENPMMNLVKGASVGLVAGIAVGYAGKKMIDQNPRMKKKASRAMRTMESMLNTAQYMFK